MLWMHASKDYKERMTFGFCALTNYSMLHFEMQESSSKVKVTNVQDGAATHPIASSWSVAANVPGPGMTTFFLLYQYKPSQRKAAKLWRPMLLWTQVALQHFALTHLPDS